jgi:LuxR family maltose regulon positive regulatory protein
MSPPRLRAASLRSDQLARIAEAIRARLLLVRAPAGYGKTTLIAAAAAELGWDCAWYRLDSSDADPASFLRSLAVAVHLRRPDVGETLVSQSAGPGDGTSISDMAAAFVRELRQADAGDLYIVLDDYDALELAGPFDEAVAALLRLLPPTVHLVLLGRRRPAFATAKLELDGGLVEITHRDLLLDGAQIAKVVELQNGATPTGETVERLLQQTEGWPAGVVLAGKAARWMDPEMLEEAPDDLALERAVFPYLAEEVYQRQPSEVRLFLRRTCCLESMTVALAEVVSESPEAQRLLEHLQSHELFTFRDSSAGAFRYHPLFRRFLERQVVREEGANAFREQQRLSADALAAHGHVASAVRLYLALGEPQPPLALLARQGTELLDACGDALLQQWVDALRIPSEAPSGWAALLDGRRLLRRGHLASAREQLESAQAALGDDRAGRYMTHRALARQSYVTGDDEESIEHARKALEAAGDRHQEAESLAALAQPLCVTCRWQELDETLAAFAAHGDAPPRLAAEMAYLEVQRANMTGDARLALAAAQRALPLVQRHATMHVGSLLYALATLSLFQGLYGESAQYLAKAQRACDAHKLAKAAAEIEVTRAALLAQGGELEAALAVLGELLAGQYAQDNPALLFEIHALSGTALRRAGHLEDAERAYERAVRTVEPAGSPYDRLNARLDLAFTLHLRGAGPKVAARMQHLMDEAARSRLLFQYAKARFYLGAISTGGDGHQADDLGSACEELLRLGHLDFLGQELAASAEAARALVRTDIDEGPLSEALGALAAQVGGPLLLASLADVSDRVALLIVGAAREHLSADRRLSLLAELRRHPSQRVRDQARRMLLSGDGGRLFPELTPREEEILALLAEGGTNQEIAARLSLTLATVKTHVHRILTKLETRGRLAASLLYQQRATAVPGHTERRA